MRSAAKECVEHHRGNTDRQPGGRVNKRLTDPARERHVTRRSDVGSKRSERMDNSKHRPQEAKERRDHSDVREVNDAVIQTGRDACALCFSDLSDQLEICVRIFRSKIEHFLHDPCDGFSMPI